MTVSQSTPGIARCALLLVAPMPCILASGANPIKHRSPAMAAHLPACLAYSPWQNAPVSFRKQRRFRADLAKVSHVEVPPGFEPGNKGFADLRLTAWLWHRVWSGRRDSDSRHPPWQGGTLPLSYYRTLWCLGAELNHRHGDFQSPALPTELPRQMATKKGLEPSTSSVTGWHSNQLNYLAV